MKPRKFAVIDMRGVVVEFRTRDNDEGAPGADEIEVPLNCDLQPGRARWDAKQGQFFPVDERAVAAAMEPVAWRAMVLLVDTLVQAGIRVPQYTRDWADFYRRTFDARGPIDGEK